MYRIEKRDNKILVNKKTLLDIIPFSVYFALVFVCSFNVEEYWGARHFNNTIGQAIANELSIASRIKSMYCWSFLMFFLIALLLLAPVFKKNRKYNDYTGLLVWPVCASINLVLKLFDGSAPGCQFVLCDKVMFSLILLQYLAITFDLRIDSEDLNLSAFISYALTIGAMSVFGCKLERADDLFVIFFVFCFVFVYCTFSNRVIGKRFSFAVTPFLLIPAVVSALIEARLLLAQRGIFFTHLFRAFVAAYALVFLLVVLRFALYERISAVSGKSFFLALFVMGIFMLCVQPAKEFYSGTELFEESNHASAVYGLFKYGELPILENFDAHFLSLEIGRILYAFLSGDLRGSIWFGYSLLPLGAVFLYLILSQFISGELSACILLFYAWNCDSNLAESVVALLPVLFLCLAVKKQNSFSYCLLWLSCAFSIFYRMDLGFGIAIGTMVAFYSAEFLRKNRQSVIRCSVLGMLSVILVLFVMTACCAARAINPLTRLLELLDVLRSNETWAYSGIGTKGIAFAVCYFILPSLSVVLAFWSLIIWKQNKYTDNVYPIIITLFINYLLNYPRALVRHSLLEEPGINRYTIGGNIILLLVLEMLYIFLNRNSNPKGTFNTNEKKLVVALPVYFIATVVLTLMSYGPLTIGYAAMNHGLWEPESFWPWSGDIGSIRVHETQGTLNTYKDLKVFFDATLEEDDTFIDFTRNTLLYALTDRKKPVYVNQSPDLVSGEYSQQCFVNECEQECPVYALLWGNNSVSHMDGINYNIKYYKIAEYIYSHYKPLCRINEYAVWCRNEEYDHKASLVSSCEGMCFPYDVDFPHEYSLNKLPFVWGEYGKDIIGTGPRLDAHVILKPGVLEEIRFDDLAAAHFIVLDIVSPEDASFSLKLMSDDIWLTDYTFSLKKGENTYAVIVSSDPALYMADCNKISLCSDSEVEILGGHIE